ncbi:50S ribosomal protein L9 [Kocuria palustris]|jgi:large subunit ribosomal protein L9|uniref:Large ribosomal subunit protein bL9 n=1 Tax=Kocuria palustris PEL TaxID=1236550 RepID=M2YEE4_9MICC|nr:MULTISPECIES: 50S ribosomal protein L9 [Kocuria]MDN5572878.1 50S ribosomal protein L9 [Micrococcales bacterium]ALB04095.1 50S ribosomal protein L9 [Kocuria palustris]EME36959.1 LSU ribosomal protein L9p [Kocuria palustris PEL]MBM7823048.1 large subunit ribosomal protein L9 [Kocuria palustris]MBN6753040.1 50S ribosomal protein L9 [Kocuria palustris]
MAKIILTHEVSNLGSAGDVVEVKDGYARNYLFPRGFATQWSKGAERQIESIKAARAARELASLEDAQALAASLTSATVTVPAKAGAEGRLFGSIKAEQVADAVKAAGLGEIDKRKVEIREQVRTVGTYQATVRLHEDVNANIEFEVVPA